LDEDKVDVEISIHLDVCLNLIRVTHKRTVDDHSKSIYSRLGIFANHTVCCVEESVCKNADGEVCCEMLERDVIRKGGVKPVLRGGSANPDIELSEISASMGDGNRLPRSRSNEKTPP